MIATKSYMDTKGAIILDGEPLQFHKRQQNLQVKPSRHRKQEPEIDPELLKLSIKDAAKSMIFLMVGFSLMVWIASIIS